MDPELARLRQRLDTMPQAEREVFERARFRNLDYLQIAAELDVTIAEVERLMAGAMRHLIGDGD